jgi:hypothetical protein
MLSGRRKDGPDELVFCSGLALSRLKNHLRHTDVAIPIGDWPVARMGFEADAQAGKRPGATRTIPCLRADGEVEKQMWIDDTVRASWEKDSALRPEMVGAECDAGAALQACNAQSL